MKLSSSLLGDFADLFQDARIEALKNSANLALTSAANLQRNDLRQLASHVELRIQEVERDNAILGMLVVRLLKHLGETQAEPTEVIIHDIREILTSTKSPPSGLDFLRQALDFPPATRTTVHEHGKAPKGPAPHKLPQPKPQSPAIGVANPVFKSPAAPKSPNPPQPPVIPKKAPEQPLPSAFPK